MNVSIQPQLQGCCLGVERKAAASLVLSSVCDDLSLESLGLKPEVVGEGLYGIGLVTKGLTSQPHSCCQPPISL